MVIQSQAAEDGDKVHALFSRQEVDVVVRAAMKLGDAQDVKVLHEGQLTALMTAMMVPWIVASTVEERSKFK